MHLTDVHVGWTTPESLLAESVKVTRSLKPDLVVLTGDYVNRSLAEIDVLEKWIERLPRPCIATLGNHDHWSGADGIATLFEKSGVRLLNNERIACEGIQIVGVDDARTKHHDIDRAFHRVDPSQKILALQHCPGVADQIAERGASLILSGHTHAGQVAIPRVTAKLFEALGQPYAGGEYELEDRCRLYVNAGLGHSRRAFRHGKQAKPEIAIFDASGARLDGAGQVIVHPGDMLTLRMSVQDFETDDADIAYAGFELLDPEYRSLLLVPARGAEGKVAYGEYDENGPQGIGDRLNYRVDVTIGDTAVLVAEDGEMTTVPSAGPESGRMISRKMRNVEAPSMRAASSSSCGMLMKNCRSRKMKKA